MRAEIRAEELPDRNPSARAKPLVLKPRGGEDEIHRLPSLSILLQVTFTDEAQPETREQRSPGEEVCRAQPPWA